MKRSHLAATDAHVLEALQTLAESGTQQLDPAPQISVRSLLGKDVQAVVELGIEGVLVAIMEMRLPPGGSADLAADWAPTRIVVTGYEDSLSLGAMQPPRSHLFRSITTHAAELLLRLGVLPSARRLPCLVRWICAFHDVFSSPCALCGRLLQPTSADPAILLPPTLRDSSMQAYHEQCFAAGPGERDWCTGWVEDALIACSTCVVCRA